VNLPDDARPTTFLTGNTTAGGVINAAWSMDLLGVVTCILGGFITSVGASFSLTQNGVMIFAGFSGGSSQFYAIDTFAELWIPVNQGDILEFGFDSTDMAATCGIVVSGWQYNLEG
jgi:hypothetical protein